MKNVIFSTEDGLMKAPAITVYGVNNYHFALFYAADGYIDEKDFEEVKVESKAFVVRMGFEEAVDFDNLSDAVEKFEELTGRKLAGTPVLAAFKAYVSALIF